MNPYQQNGIQRNGVNNNPSSQRIYPSFGNGSRGVYGNLNNPYGAGRGYNNMSGSQQQQRWPHDYYYDEDDEEKEEFQRLMINLRKVVVPQLEQLIAYIIIPAVGAWVFNKLKIKAPELPSVVNFSFCKSCKVPVDFWQNSFMKIP